MLVIKMDWPACLRALPIMRQPLANVLGRRTQPGSDLILDFKHRGLTVLLCSHLLSQVQEICDRVGILHQGRLLREGRLEELISIENQTELIIENSTPELLADLRTRITASGAKVVDQRKPQQNLERYFLDVTGGKK